MKGSKREITRRILSLILVMILMFSPSLNARAGDVESDAAEAVTVKEEKQPAEKKAEEKQPEVQKATEEIQQEKDQSTERTAEKEKLEAQDTEEPVAEEVVTEETTEAAELPTVFNFEDEEKTVTATLSDATLLPEGAVLVVKDLTKAENKKAEEIIEKQIDKKAELVSFKAYDVHFEAEGNEIEPEDGKVNVKFDFKNGIPGVSEAGDSEIQLVHIKDSGVTETVDVNTQTDAAGEVESAEFAVSEFSTFVYAEVSAEKSDKPFNNNTLAQMMSNYNVIAFGDVKFGCHTMGGVVCQGNLSGNGTFFDEGDLPSYVGGTWNYTDHVAGRGSRGVTVYVSSKNTVTNNGLTVNGHDLFYSQQNGHAEVNDNYVDWTALSSAVETEMTTLSGGSTKTIDVTSDWCTINIEAGTNVTLNMNGHQGVKLVLTGSGTSLDKLKKDTIITIPDKNAYLPLLDQNEYQHGETNNGCGLVFVCPDAETLTTGNYDAMIGHILAPKATVTQVTGDYNGCIVCKNISTIGEGHVRTYTGANDIISSLPTPTVNRGNMVFTKTYAYTGESTPLTDDQKNDISFVIEGPTEYTGNLTISNNVTITNGSCDVTTLGSDSLCAFKLTIPYSETDNGKITLTGLPVGTYKVSEENADVTGYSFTSDIPEGKSAKSVSVTEGNTTEAGITNTYTEQQTNVTINISKVDLGGYEIGGADIQVLDASKQTDNLVEQWKSEDGKTHSVELTPGDYIFHEVSAPKGYAVVTDIAFTVDAQGNVTVTTDADAADVVDDKKLEITDEPFHFVVNKTDITGDTELADAVIEIFEVDDDGNKGEKAVDSWTSKKDETHDFGDELEGGKNYVLVETTAPTGYTAIAETPFSVAVDGTITTDLTKSTTKDTDGNDIYLVKDAPIHFIVNKTDVTGETELAGAVIEIYEVDKDGNKDEKAVDSWTSKKDETHDFGDKLEGGKNYVLVETTAPTGYTGIAETPFSVAADGTITTDLTKATTKDADGNDIYLVEDAPIHFVVNKTDVTGETELVGAVIEIYEADQEGEATGTVLDTWTSAEGKTHDFGSKLEAGKSYVLKETTAPNGYTTIADTVFSVGADGTITTDLTKSTTKDTNGNDIYLVEDQPIIHFVVNKTDVTGEKELAGAVIEIYEVDKDGNKGEKAVDSWTSKKDETHDFGDKLESGKNYVLVETTAPTGYKCIAETPFSVAADGTITTDLTKATTKDADGNDIYLVEDAPIHFVVNKTDVTGETELVGAVIEIYEADQEGEATGTVLDTWTSAEGKTHDFGSKLEAGKSYVLKETTAPNGYTTIADTVFSVGADGTITTDLTKSTTKDTNGNDIYLVEDQPIIHFVVNKTDVTGETELAGAVIEIYEVGEDGKAAGDAVDSWTSKAGETHDFGDKLEGGKSYILKETTAPTGYTAIAETPFSVGVDGKITTDLEKSTKKDSNGNDIYLIEDAPIHFVVNKTDVTGETELVGAVIEIYEADKDGKATGTALDTWTSAEGKTHDFGSKLEAGKSYVLKETTAPNGYTTIADTVFSVGADGAITTDLTKSTTKDTNGNDIYLVEDQPVIHFVVNKTDVTGETELVGAVIEIYEVDDNGNKGEKAVDSWTSKKDETYDFGDKLEGGKNYVLVETTAPTGYTAIAETPFSVGVDGKITTDLEKSTKKDSDGNDIYLVEDAPIHFIVNKTDVTGETELVGAVIEIYEADKEGKATGTALDTWTSAEGKTHDFGSKLEAGKSYVLKETTAPNGYTTIADTVFSVGADGTITTDLTKSTTKDTNGNDIYLVEDQPIIHFVVNKTDVTGDTELAGAVIEIYEVDKDGNKGEKAVDSWTSKKDETHDFGDKLEGGKNYVLVETTAPTGYKCIAETPFSVGADGKIITDLTKSTTKDADGNDVYLIKDELILGTIAIHKVNEQNPNEDLEGSTYGLYMLQADGTYKLMEKKVTDRKGMIYFRNLDISRFYMVRELQAPDGSYVSKNPIYLKFDLDQDAGIALAVFASEEDRKLAGDQTVGNDAGGSDATGGGTAKLDANGNVVWFEPSVVVRVAKVDENGKAVAGAVLQIVDAKGNVVAEFTSGDKPTELTKICIIGETYTLKEVKAPKGYLLADPITFTIPDQEVGPNENKVIELSMVDKKDKTVTESGKNSNSKNSKSSKKSSGTKSGNGTTKTGDDRNVMTLALLNMLALLVGVILVRRKYIR